MALRILRREAGRYLIEVPHTAAAAARRSWNGPLPDGRRGSVRLATRRTWGTLRRAKRWLRAGRTAPPGGV